MFCSLKMGSYEIYKPLGPSGPSEPPRCNSSNNRTKKKSWTIATKLTKMKKINPTPWDLESRPMVPKMVKMAQDVPQPGNGHLLKELISDAKIKMM